LYVDRTNVTSICLSLIFELITNYYKLLRKPQKVINTIWFACYQDGMDIFSNISMTLICKRSTMIKSHILEVCAIAPKAVSIIQNSLIPFKLSKLWNLINSGRVWQNLKILEIMVYFQNIKFYQCSDLLLKQKNFQNVSKLWNYVKIMQFYKGCAMS
jgi:hypothetical protein